MGEDPFSVVGAHGRERAAATQVGGLGQSSVQGNQPRRAVGAETERKALDLVALLR